MFSIQCVHQIKLQTLGLMTMLALCGARAEDTPADSGYRISPGDVLAINVWEEENLNLPQVLVRPDGKISMPLLGEVQAGGNTVTQLQAQLRDELTRFMRDDPILTVSMLQLSGNTVYVLGKVNRPGAYVMNAKLDVLQALAMAGGLAMFADEDDLMVLRRDETGKQSARRVRYDELKNGRQLDSNLLLKGGDIVVVP